MIDGINARAIVIIVEWSLLLAVAERRCLIFRLFFAVEALSDCDGGLQTERAFRCSF